MAKPPSTPPHTSSHLCLCGDFHGHTLSLYITKLPTLTMTLTWTQFWPNHVLTMKPLKLQLYQVRSHSKVEFGAQFVVNVRTHTHLLTSSIALVRPLTNGHAHVEFID